jgi:putative hydrolase of the HAD superfamily
LNIFMVHLIDPTVKRAIFRRACRVLEVRPAQAVHIGDRLDTDAEGARDAELHGCGWTAPAAARSHRAPGSR